MTLTKKRSHWVIAMDGPAGVGKSTVGHLVAKSLGYHFINTGEMYRALTWKGLEQGLDLNDHAAVLALAERMRWFAEYGVRECWLLRQSERRFEREG